MRIRVGLGGNCRYRNRQEYSSNENCITCSQRNHATSIVTHVHHLSGFTRLASDATRSDEREFDVTGGTAKSIFAVFVFHKGAPGKDLGATGFLAKRSGHNPLRAEKKPAASPLPLFSIVLFRTAASFERVAVRTPENVESRRSGVLEEATSTQVASSALATHGGVFTSPGYSMPPGSTPVARSRSTPR